ncbi:MAG: hypothetical protein LIP01_15350 [Tannerellaceae bacterium]|nr:hypothetical protein [Tannerellaceae bacterium]
MEERERSIKKASLNGRQLTVVYKEYQEEGDSTITKKCDIPVHKDCTDAFRNLVPHLILLTEMKESDQLSHEAAENGIEQIAIEDDYKNVEVTGVKFGKNENNADTVTIIGKRLLQTGGSVDVTSPDQSLEPTDSEFDYPYIDELGLVVESVKYEAKEYLFNAKYAVTQTKIAFEATPETPFESDQIGKMVDTDTGDVTPITTNKRSGRPRKIQTNTATVPAC